MAVKIITSLRVLMQKAHALGRAKQQGTKEEIEEAQRQHDSYLELCKQADEVR